MPGKTQKSVTLRRKLVDEVKREIEKDDLKALYSSISSFIEDSVRHRIEEIKKMRTNRHDEVDSEE